MAERDVDILVESQEAGAGRKADGTIRTVRATADGSIFTAPWLIANLFDGRLFSTNAGTVTSAITSAGVAAATTPDVHIQIPRGVKFIPLHVNVSLDALTDDQDLEIVCAISNGLDASPTGPSTMTILNRNNGHSRGSRCIANSDVSAITSPVTDRDYLEFMRVIAEYGAKPVAAQSEEGQPISFNWFAEEQMPCAAVGPSELVLLVGKASRDFFSTITWLELPA